MKRNKEIIDKLLNTKYTNFGVRGTSTDTKPIESQLFKMLAIQGRQTRQTRFLRVSQQSFYKPSPDNKNMLRAQSTQSHHFDDSQENKRIIKTQPNIPRSRQNCRVVENENDAQSKRYDMLKQNFVKMTKQYRSCYGIPLSEFFSQHKFLTLIHQDIMIKFLQIFDIDCTNRFEVITYKKYQLFKKFIVWKDANVVELANVVVKMFDGTSGGEFLELINKLGILQPYRYSGQVKLLRTQNQQAQINQFVNKVVELSIQNVLKNGNLTQPINVTNLKQLLLDQRIDLHSLIDLISGQL